MIYPIGTARIIKAKKTMNVMVMLPPFPSLYGLIHNGRPGKYMNELDHPADRNRHEAPLERYLEICRDHHDLVRSRGGEPSLPDNHDDPQPDDNATEKPYSPVEFGRQDIDKSFDSNVLTLFKPDTYSHQSDPYQQDS